MEDLGQYIRQKREKKKMTIDELSKKTLISPAVLRDIEGGKFDKYTNDEAYVKMYLKKISQVLDLNNEELTQEYISLTREIRLEELRQKELISNNNEDVVKKGKDFRFTKPQLTRKPSVYEDKSHITIIRGAIILLLLCLIVVICWYGFYATRSHTDNPSVPDKQITAEGEVNEPQTTEPDQPAQDPAQPSSQNAGIEFTRNGVLDFSMVLPEGTEEFTFKVEFMNQVWASLKVNGKDYKEFEPKIYHNDEGEEPDVVELTFKVSDFEKLSLRTGTNRGHRYYINDQQIPLTDDDSFDTDGYFKLTLNK